MVSQDYFHSKNPSPDPSAHPSTSVFQENTLSIWKEEQAGEGEGGGGGGGGAHLFANSMDSINSMNNRGEKSPNQKVRFLAYSYLIHKLFIFYFICFVDLFARCSN